MNAGLIRTTFCALVCTFAGAASAIGTNYWAWGGGAKRGSFGYDWSLAENWRLSADGTTPATTSPQEGDIVIFNKSISYMTAVDSGNSPALQKIVFNVANTIHQGCVPLLAGGEGLVLSDMITAAGMSWWAGIALVGTGEVPIYVPTGKYFDGQKGILGSTTATLVKTGGGSFNTAYEGGTTYNPAKTILMGGTIAVRANKATSNHEFIFGSNDADLRLKLAHWVKSSVEKDTGDWTLRNSLLLESNVVDNTTHGITANASTVGRLTLDGTPKAAEQRFTGQLYGTAELAFHPFTKQANGENYVFTIAKSHSTAGYGLSVTNGTLQLTEGATLDGLHEVVVGAGGILSVAAESGSSITAQTLVLSDTGKLQLGEGVRLSFLSASRDGADIAANVTYTAANADWIEGEGTVEVCPAYIKNPIELTVAAGATQTLAEALAVLNASLTEDEQVTIDSLNGGKDKERTIRKRGDGTLVMDTAISSYTGDIDVIGGVVQCMCRYAFGADTATSAVNVHAGATVICALTKEVPTLNTTRSFYVAGTGFNNQGALRGGSVQIGWGTQHAFGNNLYLTDDATVYAGPWYYLPNKTITLNNHTLTINHVASSDCPVLFTKVADDGRIIFDGTAPRSASIELAGTSENNVFEMKNYGGWRFWSNAITGDGRSKWKYLFAGGECRVYGDQNVLSRSSEANTLFGPTEITKGTTLKLLTQNNTAGSTLFLRGAVSGEGDIYLHNPEEPKYLHLLNTANTFAGKVRVNRGIAYIYGAGSLPKAATLQLERANTYGGINKEGILPPYYGAGFMSADTLDLGACNLSGSYVGRVQGGLGAFTTISKSGSNTIEYYSQLGAATLALKAGTLKLPRGAAPGLWEGYQDYASADAAEAALATASPAATFVMRGPDTANARPIDNYTSSAATRVMVYTGNIWNRSNADVTWTLVSSVSGPVTVKIDDEEVLAATAAGLVKKQITLTPGSHTFEYRSCSGSPRTTDWKANAGFTIDRTGSADPATNLCELCTDPGDGSLFTRSTSAADLPVFASICMTAGASLDLNGNRYTANDIAGAGTVMSSATDESAAPELVVKHLTVNAGANETIASQVPVVLGEGFAVSVTNTAHRLRSSHITLTSTTAITGAAGAITATGDDGSTWNVALSADGKSLSVVKTGLRLLIR